MVTNYGSLAARRQVGAGGGSKRYIVSRRDSRLFSLFDKTEEKGHAPFS